MNLFEGGRRLAKIGIFSILAVGGVLMFADSPSPSVYFRVPDYGAPVVVSDECNYVTDATEHTTMRTKQGHSYYASFCFAAGEASDGRMLVPYESKGEYFMMNEKYSAAVTAYTKRFAAHFQPTAEQDQFADKAYSDAVWKSKGQIVFGTVATAIGFWLLTKLLGWVLRGFLGIPANEDKRRA